MHIDIKYSCFFCGINRRTISVPERGSEDVVRWMEQTSRFVVGDHKLKSPHCHPKTISEILIPVDGSDKIGGPKLQ